MTERFEIRPGAVGKRQRQATHGDVIAALKATAKQLGLVPKLPAGKHGGRWQASIDGLTVHGDVRRSDADVYETFWVRGDGCDKDTLLAFAGQLAARLGRQAVIGATDDEFWFVDKPTKTKTKRKRA